jgi:hypothetical protein
VPNKNKGFMFWITSFKDDCIDWIDYDFTLFKICGRDSPIEKSILITILNINFCWSW